MTTPRFVPFLLASVLATSVAAAQFSGSYVAPGSLPIPPVGTGGGGCGSGSPNLTEVSVNVPDTFVVSRVTVLLTLSHTYVGDLTLTLRHCGTEVEIYDRSPTSQSDLSGTYTFDDLAVHQFTDYVTVLPVVPTGAYAPVNAFAAFNGMSSAGNWTLSICDQAAADVGVVSSMILQLYGIQSSGGPIAPPEAISDGNGSCVSPLVRAINVPTGGSVDRVALTLGLTHTDVNDLTVSISHDGVVVTLIQAGTMAAGVDAQGLYTFLDTPLPSFAQATYTAPGIVLPGGYGPETPLSAFAGHSKAGVWILMVCDSQPVDVGTLSHAELFLSDSAWNLELTQPNGSSSLVFTNSGGAPGNVYLNLLTVVPGSFPNGWLNGLDISMSQIVALVALGPPIVGALASPCGNAITVIPGPIPSGLPIQLVSFELDASGTPVAAKQAFQYVTQ